jgi:hypothetical protein
MFATKLTPVVGAANDVTISAHLNSRVLRSIREVPTIPQLIMGLPKVVHVANESGTGLGTAV